MTDKLDAARGVVYGLVLCLAFWLAVYWLAWG
jgi:hypothetical protein